VSIGTVLTIALITWRVYRITRPFRAMSARPPGAMAPAEINMDDEDDVDDESDDSPKPKRAVSKGPFRQPEPGAEGGAAGPPADARRVPGIGRGSDDNTVRD
jgi:hypothetical protein